MSKEIQQIIGKMNHLEADARAALATVIDVQGSSYRLPGAKMLILETGETFGTISGGCLEADVLERAKKVLRTNEPQVFVYDTTANDESVFSLNMGCRGIISILLEPARENAYLEFLKNCFEQNKKGVAAVLVSSSDGLKIGTRLLIDEMNVIANDFAGEARERILMDAKKFLITEKSSLQDYEFGKVFYEFVEAPVNLFIFGAGADAVPLAEIAGNLGWRVYVIDHRPAFANSERFPQAAEIILSRPENARENLSISKNSVAVVMTHNYESDKQIQKFLLSSNLKYVGALGPKKRTDSILRELSEETGENFSRARLKNLHAPVGLDIGARTPEAIALSIIAEIQAVLSNRAGGFLRNRTGSIYNR